MRGHGYHISSDGTYMQEIDVAIYAIYVNKTVTYRVPDGINSDTHI